MGRQNKVIAFDLGISVRTVEVHRARMMERLGTRKLADAVRLAVLAKLAASGVVRPDETVVAYITGMGLKTLEAFGERFTPAAAIQPKLEALAEALGRLGLGTGTGA